MTSIEAERASLQTLRKNFLWNHDQRRVFVLIKFTHEFLFKEPLNKLSTYLSGEYVLKSSGNSNSNELDNLSLEEALQLVGIEDLNVSIERKPLNSHLCNLILMKFSHLVNQETIKKDSQDNKLDEAAKVTKEENSSAEDLEAILENNLKEDDFDFDLNSPLSILLDETDDLDLLNEMMIQPSSTHFQHPRQPNQNYAHCVNSYRQNGYQVSQICERIKWLSIVWNGTSRKNYPECNSLRQMIVPMRTHCGDTKPTLGYLFSCLLLSIVLRFFETTKCHRSLLAQTTASPFLFSI